MPSSAADSSNTSFETSSNAFSRSRKMVAERALYPLLQVVIGAALCTSVAMASVVPTPLLKPREYGLIGWADHLTLASTCIITHPSLFTPVSVTLFTCTTSTHAACDSVCTAVMCNVMDNLKDIIKVCILAGMYVLLCVWILFYILCNHTLLII